MKKRIFKMNEGTINEFEVMVVFQKEDIFGCLIKVYERSPLCYFEYSIDTNCLYHFTPIDFTYDNFKIYNEKYIQVAIEEIKKRIKAWK